MRADDAAAFERVVAAVPAEVGGATLHPELVRAVAGHGLHRGDRAAAGARLGRARASRSRRCARGGASDASHFAAAHPGHGRRARPARRRRPQPRRVHRRRVAGHPRGGRAGGARRPRSAADGERLELARAQQHDQLALPRRAGGPPRSPPFLKSTRPPVRSWTTWANDGSWPTTSTFASPSWRASSSSASSTLEAVAEHVLDLGVDVERLGTRAWPWPARAPSGWCRRRRTRPRAAPARRRPRRTAARRARSAPARRRAWSHGEPPPRGGEARAAGPRTRNLTGPAIVKGLGAPDPEVDDPRGGRRTSA